MPFDRALFFKELGRKAFHIGGCIIPAAYFLFIPREWMLGALFLCILGAGILEYMRLTGRDLFRSEYMRESESKRLGGYFYAAVSLFLAVLLFEKTIAVAAMLCLVIGDALTGLAGVVLSMYMGRRTADVRQEDTAKKGVISRIISDTAYALSHPKTPVLMIFMFAICSAIGLLFYPALPLVVIAAGALGAVIADCFPWRFLGFVIDDNLSIPLVAGILMSLSSLLYNIIL
ncbi:diacylglycerol/polyprenol kinase family protein [Methanocella sp. MCL-LM]|uniref:diacylglycerol/polyprenol kinase family protein n=1 Tax=Methanocella sp. MCL-LM TaxID=3412035 RepID=UPI003C73FAD6